MIKLRFFLAFLMIACFVNTPLCLFSENLRDIEISTNFLTYIYFNDTVTQEPELGLNEDIDIGVENNIVKITALIPFNYSTNLTVNTSKGTYAYFIKYNKNPKNIYNSVQESDMIRERKEQEPRKLKEEKEILKINKKSETSEIKGNADLLIKKYANNLFIKGNGKGRVDLYLYPIAIKDDYMYFKLNAENNSDISYEIEGIYFSVVGKKRKAKRYVSIPNRLKVEYIHNKIKQIKPNDNEVFIYAFKKFTIDKDKLLRIEMYEKNGERNISIFIKPKFLYKATLLK